MNTVDRAEELVIAGKYTDALALIQTLYDQTLPGSDRGRALALEVVILESLDQGQEAHNLIDDIMKDEGDDYTFVLAAGVEFAELNAFPHAEMFLKNLCELVPDDPVPWFNLAISLGREARYPESIAAYETCLTLDPEFAEVYFQKAHCHQLMGELDLAASTYTTYLERTPQDGEAWIGLGVIYSDLGNFQSAYDAFEKASKVDFDQEEVYYNWAITAVRNQDTEQIQQCIEELQELNPNGWRTLMTRADYEEGQDHIWPAWEILLEAFDEAIEDEELDPASRDYVIATILRFANRNQMHEHASEVVTRIFDEGLFGEDVLGGLQILEGKASNTAASYQVVLKTNVEESDNVFFEGSERFIVYGVSSQDPDQALVFAQAFESKCSTETWAMDSIYQLSDADEGLLGVYWRSALLDTRPGQ
ncbi:MAG: tetratricopeptide repeat protein [Candidatus Hydrogenedentota bacterium]